MRFLYHGRGTIEKALGEAIPRLFFEYGKLQFCLLVLGSVDPMPGGVKYVEVHCNNNYYLFEEKLGINELGYQA